MNSTSLASRKIYILPYSHNEPMQLDFWNMYCNFHWHLEYKIFYILIIGKDKKILNRPQGAESWLSPSELKGLGFGFKYLGKCTRFYCFEHRSCSTRATETDWHYQCPGLNWDIFGIHPINSVLGLRIFKSPRLCPFSYFYDCVHILPLGPSSPSLSSSSSSLSSPLPAWVV